MDESTNHEGCCPVCGYRALPGYPDHVRHEIRPICYWEDDLVQQSNPDPAAGANDISPEHARENFQKYGAIEPRFTAETRKPTGDDDRDWPDIEEYLATFAPRIQHGPVRLIDDLPDDAC